MPEVTPNGPTPSRYKPYPAYMDSGVEWLGRVPVHWSVTRTKFAARLRSGHTPSRQHPEYWVNCMIPWFGLADVWQIRDGQIDYVTETAEKISELGLANSAARLLPKGTVILSRTASVGFAAILGVDMATTQDFVNWVCGPTIRPEYLLNIFRAMQAEFRRLTMGSTHQTIYMPDVGGFSTPIPPISEQERIVTFLQEQTQRIDALVAKNERLIELLREKRTALITRAVTRGLEPDVPMKESGVEWLDTPLHWNILALSRVTLSRCDGPFGSDLKSEHYSMSGVRVVRLQNIGWAQFLDADRAYLRNAYASQLGDHGVLGGDVLIAGLGDERHPVGRACVAPDEVGPAMVKADCFRFRLDRQRVVPRFVAYQLSATSLAAAGSLATGATRARMNLTATASRKIALPPRDEQRAIVEALDRQADKHTALVAKVRVGIERLEELRTTLISAAVTGKIDVRDLVAGQSESESIASIL